MVAEANGGGGDYGLPVRLRFVGRLLFQACTRPGGGLRGAGRRRRPLKELLPLLHAEARGTRSRALEARRRPGVVGRTRAVRLRWP